MKYLKSLCIGLVTVVMLHAQAQAGEPTKADATAMVKSAIGFYKANGKDKFLTEVNVKDGRFHKGELYVFVYDGKASILAHPVNPKLIGKQTLDLPDVNGKMYRKEIVEIATSKGSGWVDYVYKNPVSEKSEPKTAYFEKIDDLILVAGIYKN